jgi:hypothetical protein
VIYCLDRAPTVAKEKPGLADVEPFKTVLSVKSRGDRRGEECALEAALYRSDIPADDQVLRHFRASGYRTYVVTSGGQDFVRVYADATYGIPPEHASGTQYGYDKNGRPFLTKEPKLAQRQQRRQTRKHPFDDRTSAARCVRQLHGRSRDAGVHQRRRRRANVAGL